MTGFGLLGHGLEMARGVRDALRVRGGRPAGARRARSSSPRTGVETGGAAHNRRFVRPALTVADGVAPELVALAHDPQTSGGLLAAVPADRADTIVEVLRIAGIPCQLVGRVEAAADGRASGSLVLA